VDLDALVEQMTVDEMAAIIAGVDLWNTPAVERLGIPALRVSDGPNGARGPRWTGIPAACFPCGAALGATWDPDLLERVGRALGEEARTKGAHVLLAPTVNLHRHPTGGRHFESYSEDPHLTARLAVAFVQGVQSTGVGTTVKHFVANDTEHERMTISSEVDERVLRELYLLPFEATVKEAGAWGVMSAYNRLNGTYCGEHPWLLTTVLRDEWGFDGFVISDWFGTHSTAEAANAGLDLEMPGPPIWFGKKLAAAVDSGEVTIDRLKAMARSQLVIRERAGAFDGVGNGEPGSNDDPDRRALARETAAQSFVLLRNEAELLPLDPARVRSIAVVGPGADALWIMGGGSATVDSLPAVAPVDGIRTRAAQDGVEITFARACATERRVPVINRRRMEGGTARVEYFATPDCSGDPVRTEQSGALRLLWMGSLEHGLEFGDTSVRVTARFTADETGDWTFGLTSAGKARLLLDGETILDNWTSRTPGDSFFGFGSTEVTATVPMEAGETRELRIELSTEGAFGIVGLLAGAAPPAPDDMLDHAVAVAAAADVAVVVVGTGPDWETEGEDRSTMDLPGDGAQDELVRRVAAANPNTVVCVNAGSPVTMDWTGDVPAVLQCWLPGMEWGDALADVLFGDREPGGRLPTTIPVRIEDTPAFPHYPGGDDRAPYGEGLLVGYRHYDTTAVSPRFPFGHGLGYGRFEYGEARLDGDVVRIAVTNTSDRASAEVVQVYVHRDGAPADRPDQELRGFRRLTLDPGQSREVEITLDPRSFMVWDGGWRAVPGDYEIRVGRSSRDVRSTVRTSRR
jgi:beta-glucosidase